MKQREFVVVLISCLALGLAGCATNTTHEQTKKGAGIGALVGAVSGAVIGYQNDHSGGALRGALIGGAAGGALGAGAGAYMDKQQTAFEKELSTERAQNQIEIERQKNEILKLTMSSEVSFDFNSATINSTFYSSLNKIAEIMKKYPKTQILIVGHTDDVGSDEYNLQLSLKRANAVADYLIAQGVEKYRLGTEGHGEIEPVADNNTPGGRAQNRRVEIFVAPEEGVQY
jgi:outer membrane protein OmpA-like peptidoglycan-associated protein